MNASLSASALSVLFSEPVQLYKAERTNGWKYRLGRPRYISGKNSK